MTMTLTAATAVQPRSRWDDALSALGIAHATLVYASPVNLNHRVYRVGTEIYKVVLTGARAVPAHKHYRQLPLGEYQILSRCRGIAGVPQVLRHESAEDVQAVVLEEIPAVSATEIPLDPFRAARIFILTLLLAIRLAARGVSHGDIRTRNVLISRRSKIFLIDFDQASIVPRPVALVRNLFGAECGGGHIYGWVGALYEELNDRVKRESRNALAARAPRIIPF